MLPTPAPIRFIPFVMTSLLDQVAVPAGTTTVSPALALETAALTSAKEALAAVITSAYTIAIILLVLLELEPAPTVSVPVYAPAAAYE